MRQVVPNVYMMERLSVGNVYLVVSSKGLLLVDSGLAGEADQIVAQMQEKGYALSDLRAIVLTHAHGDHAGNTAELVVRSGAHVKERSYVEQNKSTTSTTPARPYKVDRTLHDGDVIEALGGRLGVIHSPGHTPGSICLYQPERRILFCGDVLINKGSIMGKKEVKFCIPLSNVDETQEWESVRKLSMLSVEVLCFGHGEPVIEGAGEHISALLEDRP